MLIMPVSSLSIQKLDSDSVIYHAGSNHMHMKDKYDKCYDNYNKKCKYYGYSQIHFSIKGNKSELNEVKKVKVKINGKTIKTYKNVNFSKSKRINLYFDKTFIKRNIKGKKYTIEEYNKNNKILKIKKGKIKSISKYPLFFPPGYPVSPTDTMPHVP
ncbi:MAG: hypothetical protein LBU74_08245 [Methanobacteriaceae archaeon]|nr:hypothetical protein [Candidatus Methanorudis spinitermitis]